MTIHNNAKIGEIAKTVIMPGDPLRAKYIAENFMDDAKLVNDKRGMYAYTGKFLGKVITVMASGMGMPSMGIYAYELYKFYDVENIIRIGSCGSYVNDLNLMDIVLVDESCTLGNFAEQMSGEKCYSAKSSKMLNSIMEYTANELKIKYTKSNCACTECFDAYMENPNSYIEKLPKEKNIKCSEMETFSLFYVAKRLEKNASCLLTVSDSKCKKEILSAEKRQNSFNEMIKLALNTAIKL